jgi:hypothetical protein
MNGLAVFTTNIMAIELLVQKSVDIMLPIARDTIRRDGAHSPTAILHTVSRVIPVMMTFQDIRQRRDQVEEVKKMALEEDAYAVSAISCARVVDCRLSVYEEALVIATTARGLPPYFVKQNFIRDAQGNVIMFEDPVKGEDAWAIGQMMILPEWDATS